MVLALMVALVAATAAWMTRPLWRMTVDAGQRRRAANVAAYRQRLAELDADAAAGLVDADTAAGLRVELDARLLQDAEAAEATPLQSGRAWITVTVLSLAVATLAALGYVDSGSWKTQQQIAAAPAERGVAGGSAPDSVENMMLGLQKRLQEQPGDVNGWALLGRSMFSLERYQEASEAFAKANALTGEQEPDLLVDEGEARGFQTRDLSGLPQQRFEAALKLDPKHAKGLWYAGMAAEQNGDLSRARAYWTDLAKQDIPDSLRAVINERLGGSTSTAPPEVAAEAAAPVFGLKVKLSVAAALASKIDPDATLFVFAKAAAGPPMPLAVYRGSARELPLTVSLDDSMAMMPELKLSQFDRWVVTARVSRAGQATAVSGDLQGSLTVARDSLGDAALELVLDQVVP